jgi:hypothetical protein
MLRKIVITTSKISSGDAKLKSSALTMPQVEAKSKKLTERYPRISALVRDYSLQRIAHHSGRRDFAIQEIENWDDFCYGSYTSLIMVAGKDLRILYKVHFKAKDFINEFTGVTNKFQLFDYFREYCNLMAGSIKKELRLQNYVCGISLPTITSGYDEIVFSDPVKEDRLSDYFAVATDKSHFTVTLHLETENIELLESLNNLPYADKSADESEIEFM